MKAPPTDLVLTSEAARILGVSAQSVRIWNRRGVLKARLTTSGVRLFARREVEQLAEQRRQLHGVDPVERG